MKEHYDVIVGGGGAAGVASAIGASRTGARTLLIERGPCLGGAATMRNVLTYCGIYTNEDPPRQVVYGVAEEVLAALRAEGAVSGPQRFTAPAVVFDPEALKRVLDELCAAAGVEVRLDSQIIAAHRDDGRISSLQVADHAGVHEQPRTRSSMRLVRRTWPASPEPRSATATTAWSRTARWACGSVAGPPTSICPRRGSSRRCARHGRRASVR